MFTFISHITNVLHKCVFNFLHFEPSDTLMVSQWNLGMFCSGGEFLSVIEWSSVKQGTQHFTDDNKVSRKWSDSVHLLPFQLNKNNTTTHWVLIVKIQNQKSIKLSYKHLLQDTFTNIHKTNNQSIVPNLYNI